MYYVLEVVGDDQFQFGCFEEVFQQQDWLVDIGFVQFQVFFDVGYGEVIGFGCQCFSIVYCVVVVCVCFDYCECMGVGGFVGQLIVVMKGLQVDQGMGGVYGDGFFFSEVWYCVFFIR